MAVGSKYKFVHKINAEAGDQTMLKRKKKTHFKPSWHHMKISA